MALDHETVHGGKSSATIRCRNKHCGEFGNIVQTVKSDEYQGRRIRLSAWVKGNQAGHVGLWMRVDGAHSEVLAFDNMQRRGKEGTFDWRLQEIVLDVEPSGVVIHFGIILEGGIDDVTLAPVEGKVRTTNMMHEPSPPRGDPDAVRRMYNRATLRPVTPDFEQPLE